MMWEAAAAQDQGAGRRDPDGPRARGLRLRRRAQGCGPSTSRPPDGARETLHGARTSSPRRRCASWSHGAHADADLACSSAATLRYRDFLTVALIVKTRRTSFPDNWIYIHDPRVKVGRIQNFKSWSPEMVPDRR